MRLPQILPGLAHLLEHMAFKGTARIGSRDWPREQALLRAQDEVFYELRELQQTAEGSGRSSSRSAQIQQLQERLGKLKVSSTSASSGGSCSCGCAGTLLLCSVQLFVSARTGRRLTLLVRTHTKAADCSALAATCMQKCCMNATATARIRLVSAT